MHFGKIKIGSRVENGHFLNASEFPFIFFLFHDTCMLASVLEYLKKEEFKKELKEVMHPIFEIMAQAAKPYFFYCIFFVLINFILLATIFFYLVRFKPATM
jgi:hypothetical protein